MAFSAEANAVANFVIAVILLKGGFVPVAQNLVSAHLLQIYKLILSVVHIIEFIGHIGNVIFAFLSEHLSACVLFAVKYDVGYGVFRDCVARNVGQLSLEALTILGTVKDCYRHFNLALIGNKVQIERNSVVVLIRLSGIGLGGYSEGVVAAEISAALYRNIHLGVVWICAV